MRNLAYLGLSFVKNSMETYEDSRLARNEY